jgi:hypothetical protein
VDNRVLSDLRYPVVPRLIYESLAGGKPRGSLMEWIIESYDRRTDRDGENRYSTESAFISAAEELLRNIWRGFVSATLPDGRVLDEKQLRALIVQSASNH